MFTSSYIYTPFRLIPGAAIFCLIALGGLVSCGGGGGGGGTTRSAVTSTTFAGPRRQRLS
ncbi:MAG: hypothetical protein OEN48_18295 [Betaproteobacteria bacterium]|nr:hypothetical protein [Gammaproteobacteria bacterium]MDH3438912.1 hypothetical protein [Betaproteobacteria bacterium]